MVVLVGVIVVVALVAVGGIVWNNVTNHPRPTRSTTTEPAPPLDTSWVPPKQEPPPGMPTPGASVPTKDPGQLTTKAMTVTGSGSLLLTYQRLAGNGTHVRFSCVGCTNDTWLIDQTRPWPLSGGALPDPAEYEYVLDSVNPTDTTTLYVRAAAKAKWTLTLTPFDSLDIARTGVVKGRDSRVVRVSSAGELRLACHNGPWVKTFFKAPGTAEYDVGLLLSDEVGGEWDISMPRTTDTMVAIISCRGDWTLTVP